MFNVGFSISSPTEQQQNQPGEVLTPLCCCSAAGTCPGRGAERAGRHANTGKYKGADLACAQVPRHTASCRCLRNTHMQGTREVEGLVFTMVSDLGKLKRKVDLLGSAKDTMSHRCVWHGLACLHPCFTRGWARAHAPSPLISNLWPGGVGSACSVLLPADGVLSAWQCPCIHVYLLLRPRTPATPHAAPSCFPATEDTAAVHTVNCVLHTPEQGGACQPEPQHTVHSQGHQDAAGGPQQGAVLTARAAAGKVAKADAGLCSSTAGMRSCSNQPPASTPL